MTQGIFCTKQDGVYMLSSIDRSVVTRLYEQPLDADDDEIGEERTVWYDENTGFWRLTPPD
jgi:hypothetical protein